MCTAWEYSTASYDKWGYALYMPSIILTVLAITCCVLLQILMQPNHVLKYNT